MTVLTFRDVSKFASVNPADTAVKIELKFTSARPDSSDTYDLRWRSTKPPPTDHRPPTTDHSDTYYRPPTRHHRPPTTYLKNNRPPTKGTIDHRSEKPPTTTNGCEKTDHDQNNNRPPTRLRLLSHRPDYGC